jgi:glutaredoxin 3
MPEKASSARVLRKDPFRQMPADVVMYRTRICPYCVLARRLLSKKGVEPREIDVTRDGERRSWLRELTRRRTVPQIFINQRHVGGFQELAALERAGRLDALLAEPAKHDL